MFRHYRLSLAAAIATLFSPAMTAIAQEVPEPEVPPPPDQVLPDETTAPMVYEPSQAAIAVEAAPSVEFSQPQDHIPATSEALAPVPVAATNPVPSAPELDAPEAASTPVSYQETAPPPPPKPPTTVAQVVVPTQAVVVPTVPTRPVAAAESQPKVEFAAPTKPVSTNTTLAEATQTQIQIEQTSGPPAAIAAPSNPQVLQNQLQQLQQQQQQLQEQINTLKQQVVVPSNDAAVVVKDTHPQQVKVTGEALFWKPGTSDTLDYAISDPGTALATSGAVETVELDQATGGRFGLNYRLPKSGFDVGGKYTFFDTQGASSATAPPNGFLFSTQSHPFQNETADTANANATLGYKAGDLEAGYNLRAGKAVDVRLFGGVRVADVNRSTTTNYNGGDYTNGQVETENRFTGAGPRVGAEAKVPLGAGFSLFGRAAASMQVGSLTSSFRETDRAGADVIADIEQKQDSHVVPGLELAAGVTWEKALSKKAKINISGGYETQNLFNVTNNVQFVDAASPGVFSQSNGDLSLKGFFVKGGVSVEF